MSRISKLWPILALTVLALLFSAAPSPSFLYLDRQWEDSDLPVGWEINQDGTADCTEGYELLRKV